MIRTAHEQTYIASQGKLTSPGNGAVLADTGAIAERLGTFECFVVMCSDTAGWCELQHRDVANAANVDVPTPLLLPAGGVSEIIWPMYLQAGERVRVVTTEAIGGIVGVSLRVQCVAGRRPSDTGGAYAGQL